MHTAHFHENAMHRFIPIQLAFLDSTEAARRRLAGSCMHGADEPTLVVDGSGLGHSAGGVSDGRKISPEVPR
jgi:hypothetical protein